MLFGFNPCSNGLSAQRYVFGFYKFTNYFVSILVLMDFRLKAGSESWEGRSNTLCFNPCSNGLSAQRIEVYPDNSWSFQVSILVLMDFRLKASVFASRAARALRFNPCSNGLSAQSRPFRGCLLLLLEFQSLF